EIKYFFYDHENQLTVSDFSITGTATKMLELIVANTNRAGQLGWRIGRVATAETKTIDFSNYNCLAALTRIAEEFDVEFWIDADKSIHLENRSQASGYRLEYGKSKGIKSISRNPYTEASLVTRLYAQGGAKNLPANYRSGQKRLRMPVPYLEKNTAFYGVVEHVQNFDEIYPKRVGTVTKVFDNEPRMFADETLDFDLNEYNQYGSKYLIAGTSAKVIFQTGDLAGYVLEVQKGGFNSQTKAFTLLKNKEEKAFEIPSAQFKPRVGDKYILVDIMMPETYVLEAERELQAAAQKYLDKNSKQRFVYGIVPDPLYLKKINFSLNLGNTIRFKDEDFGLDADIRVVSITRDINNPYLTTFEIAEQPTITQLVRNYIEKEKRDNIIIAEQRKNEQRISEAYETMQEIQ
ncbi:phage tail protein, partial [Ornithobacterium rhinotracheale]|uniref:phage tail protein n=1 Tax=Ornithobacterium rhinotracheale TaxID=28251 RepID=UPI00403A3164